MWFFFPVEKKSDSLANMCDIFVILCERFFKQKGVDFFVVLCRIVKELSPFFVMREKLCCQQKKNRTFRQINSGSSISMHNF